MSSHQITAPPRVLSARHQWRLFLDSSALSLGLFLSLLVGLGLFLLCFLYDCGFRHYRLQFSEIVEIAGRVTSVESEALPSGGRSLVVKAKFLLNGENAEAKGYGGKASILVPGDEVTIVIPKNAPSQSFLKGLDPRPVRFGVLLKFACLFCLPSVGLFFWTIWGSRKTAKLLREGEVLEAKPIRQIPLPRPVAELALVQIEFQSSEGPRRTWKVCPKGQTEYELLVAPKVGTLSWSSLEPRVELVGEEWKPKEAGSAQRLNGVMLAFHLLLGLGFLFS